MGVIFGNGVYYSGPPGRGIQSIVQNDDSSLTFTMTDGTTWTSETFEGPRGNGIKSISVSVDGRFVFTLDDDTTFQSPPVNALPDVELTDAGKILQVNDEGEWEIVMYDPLPEVSDTDSGKVLQVNDEGEWSADELNVLPTFDAEDEGKILYVDENGELVVGYADSGTWIKYDGESGESEGAIRFVYSMLPDVQQSDAGKFLMVGDDGNWTIGALSDGSGVQF